jgi:hypothetical protein
LAAALAGGNAGFAIWNHSGMENALYAGLLAASLTLTVRESRDPDAKPWSAPVVALLALTRPEAPGLAVIAGLFLLSGDLIAFRRPGKRFLIWMAIVGGVFGGYQLWHYAYFAHLLPNTAYAKLQPALGERLFRLSGGGWRYVIGFVKVYGWLPLLALCLPAFLSRRTWREAAYFALTALFLLFFPLVANGDWMKCWRFLSPLPIPMALLLGYAAWNVGEWIKRLSAGVGGEQAAQAAAIVVAAAWVLGPIALSMSGSAGVLDEYREDRDASAKGIARRAEWWSGVARRLAVRPADLLMCDMDMGGTSYNWRGRIMDIGYLLDVPMATHRYTKHWPRMMDQYFFQERRPDFIHIRRGWGKLTTIPDNPKFAAQYLRLPEDKKFGASPNGNFVRRDLFELGQRPIEDFAPIAFKAGLILAAAEIPAAMDAGRKTPVFLTWRRESDQTPDCPFAIGLARPGDQPAWTEYRPLMGWLPTSAFPRDRFIRETVYVEPPAAEGAYEAWVAVDPSGGDRQAAKLPGDVIVGRDAAKREAARLLAEAGELAGAAETAAKSAVLLRRAEQIMGEKSARDEVRRIERRQLASYVRAAEAARDNDPAAAARWLFPAWRLDPRDRGLRRLGWEVADDLYEQGRKRQKQGDVRGAFADFSAACQAQPQHAWARRRAEETRVAAMAAGG